MGTHPALPLVSVIVPFRDAARWLRPCMESLSDQALRDGGYEVVAIDNGSTDGSAEIVRDFPEVRLLHEPRAGAYRARNLGVSESVGSILAFTDADCTPQPDWIASIVTALADPQVSIVLGVRLAGSRSPVLSLWSGYERVKEEQVFSGDALDLYYGHTNNMAVRRSCFERYGPFLERLRGSDTIFVRTVADALGGGAVSFRPEMRVRHLELTGPMSLLRKFFIYGRSSVAYRRVVSARPLSFAERWRVFRSAVCQHGLSSAESALLFGFLALGVVAWTLGSASGRLTSSRWTGLPAVLSSNQEGSDGP